MPDRPRPVPRPRGLGRDLPPPPGVTLVEGGADVAVYAGHADGVYVCLFDAGRHRGHLRAARAARSSGPTAGGSASCRAWVPGQRYNVRVAGEWSPDTGLRHNAAKLLLDPYARARRGRGRAGARRSTATSSTPGGTATASCAPTSTAGATCRAASSSTTPSTGRTTARRAVRAARPSSTRRTCATRPPCTPTCPRSCAARMPGWPTPRRSPTSPSWASPRSSCCRCRPSPTSRTSSRRGLRNHWGYNTLGFFAPHADYAAADDPQGVVDEVKGMVKLLHREGIEVILDVVYNHTAEQDRTGATLSWRGLDQRAYYRLDERGRDIDVTGCGNTLDLRHPVVCRMVLDSLRYWVQEFHVDGFRFDLAVALGPRPRRRVRPRPPVPRRAAHRPGALPGHPHRRAVGPRDARLAHRPVPPAVPGVERPLPRHRAALLGQRRAGPGARPALARAAGPRHPPRRLARPVRRTATGGRPRRSTSSPRTTASPWPTSRPTTTSTTRPTARATATAATATPRGTTASRAPTDDEAVVAARARTIRNLLGTLLLSTGVPMVNAGDEMGRTQGGNNNAYCQDNDTSWLDWDLAPWQRRPPRDHAAPGAGAPGAAGPAPAGLGPRPPGARRRQPRHGVVRRRRHGDGPPLGPPGHPGGADVRRRGLDGCRVGARGRQRRRPRARGDPARGHPASRPTGCSGTATTSARSPPREPQSPGTVTVAGTSLRVYAAADVS